MIQLFSVLQLYVSFRLHLYCNNAVPIIRFVSGIKTTLLDKDHAFVYFGLSPQTLLEMFKTKCLSSARCPNILSKIPTFVATNTSWKISWLLLKIFSVLLLTNVEALSRTVVSRQKHSVVSCLWVSKCCLGHFEAHLYNQSGNKHLKSWILVSR